MGKFAMRGKKTLGGVAHLSLFLGSNLIERSATSGSFAVLNFSEVDFIFRGRDNVDLISFGFEIMSDDGMVKIIFKIGDDSALGSLAGRSGGAFCIVVGI